MRRIGVDRSQAIAANRAIGVFRLNAWIGFEFYLFVRYYETGGQSAWASRPPGVEGWLPIASLMNLKVLLATGQMPRLHPAGMFLLIAFLAASWLFRKSFCGWLCPVGTISEYLWRLGRQTFGRNFRLPRKLDLGLRSLKYLLLALFLYAVGSMTVPAILAFLEGPYGIVDDVKMLNFFRFMGLAGGIVVAGLVLASVVRAELLVPLPVPVRRADGPGVAGQPVADPARGLAVHRLRQVREGLPFGAACRPADHHPVGGVHRVPGVRRGVSGGGSVDDGPRPESAASPPGRSRPERRCCSSGFAGMPSGGAIGGRTWRARSILS